jgi:hypothetical protein
MPRAAANSATRSTTFLSAPAALAKSLATDSSVSERVLVMLQSRVRRPRACGLHRMTPMPPAAERQHLTLLLAIQKIDQVLHADEAGPAMALRYSKRAGELPCIEDAPM